MAPGPHDVDRLVAAIEPLLAGHSPELQGAALANLLAIFLAGNHPVIRDHILDLHIAAVKGLIPIEERLRFGPRGFPTT